MTDVASVYTLLNFVSQPPIIPVAGADLEDLTRNARVCLSMLNTLLRRIKKRPMTGAASASAVPVSARIWSEHESKNI
jgi:nitrate reductase cytochrome c-type subunit